MRRDGFSYCHASVSPSWDCTLCLVFDIHIDFPCFPAGLLYSWGRVTAKSLPWVASKILRGWLPLACSSFSLGVPLLVRVRLTLPSPRVVDRRNEKRSLFGVLDNTGNLGNFKKHPKELIKGPMWLPGWRGNELNIVSERRQWLETECSLRTCTTLTNRLAISQTL